MDTRSVRNTDRATPRRPNLPTPAYPIPPARYPPSLAVDASTDQVKYDSVAPAMVIPVLIVVTLSRLDRVNSESAVVAAGQQASCDLARVVVVSIKEPFPLVMTPNVVMMMPVMIMMLPVIVVFPVMISVMIRTRGRSRKGREDEQGRKYNDDKAKERHLGK